MYKALGYQFVKKINIVRIWLFEYISFLYEYDYLNICLSFQDSPLRAYSLLVKINV